MNIFKIDEYEKNFEVFGKYAIRDIKVVTVYLSRAEDKYAVKFKKLLEDCFTEGFDQIIIDIKFCDFVGQLFWGSIIGSFKNASLFGIDIYVVIHPNLQNKLHKEYKLPTKLKTYNSLEVAIYEIRKNKIRKV